jgi:hypothetical protein
MLQLFFLIRFCIYAQADLDCDSPIYTSPVGEMTGVYHHAQFLLVKMGVWLAFCQGWIQTAVLQISTSQESKVTGVSHHT